MHLKCLYTNMRGMRNKRDEVEALVSSQRYNIIGIRETKLQFKLASVVSDNKGFLKYVNSKRRSKENIGLILVEDGHLTNRDEEKTEAFFCFNL